MGVVSHGQSRTFRSRKSAPSRGRVSSCLGTLYQPDEEGRAEEGRRGRVHVRRDGQSESAPGALHLLGLRKLNLWTAFDADIPYCVDTHTRQFGCGRHARGPAAHVQFALAYLPLGAEWMFKDTDRHAYDGSSVDHRKKWRRRSRLLSGPMGSSAGLGREGDLRGYFLGLIVG
ncbi:hypothetical protein GLOTRDRAFT_132640 [Gloeophyllum trabeum ATCC 11539]|uniref:Uncharacterized protein n=1 Tax=Gloeophyllum trabeum (strain ATCC 11539 / FP-39264 / Madison 617) TaxID=670483 RepID=S7RGY4_GLOTA|nr:uncharacterized protein GLOTRDRAFT_132640 [Gloeophyllum trabeum ATCC 11539]EPQ51829.1 hypothetical protein GLOTRDRAFT_132640 [Gloeophyllum trabeum ATCC 11539]